MNMIQITFIELIVSLLLVYCFWHEEKFIAFEEKVVKMFKDIVSIIKAARKQKLSVKEFFTICWKCACETFQEKFPWFGEDEKKLIRNVTTDIVFICIIIAISIFLIQRCS